jgi:valacyclovir hydrolase
MPEVTVRGVQFHYESHGSGEVLLCLPGALGTGESDFAPQLAELARYYRVIAPDPRGYGRSRPPERDFPVDFFQCDADDMAALMMALGHTTFNLAGWSDGANSSLLLAITYPQRVRRLVLWGGSCYVAAEDLVANEHVRDLATWSPRMRASLEAIYGEQLQALWHAWCDVLQAIFRAGGEICQQRLPLIRCPALILHGAQDPLVPDFHPKLLHNGIANAQLHVFPDGKHNIHLRYASAFNRLVYQFLQETAAAV